MPALAQGSNRLHQAAYQTQRNPAIGPHNHVGAQLDHDPPRSRRATAFLYAIIVF